MSARGEGYGSDVDIVDPSPVDDVTYVEPVSTLDPLANRADLVDLPPTSDLTTRIDDTGDVSGDDTVVLTTSDGFVTSGDIAGEDVVDFGIASDASLGGLGTNIDDLPGDEAPISRENIRTGI